MKHILRFPSFYCLILHAASALGAAPVKLGILSDGSSRAAAELLTVELGRSPEFELVERDQVEKVLDEQSAAALSEDPGAAIKVGGLLHADAILFIGGRNVRGATQRVLRLSAVEPGVVVHVATEPAPEAGEEPAWAKSLAFRLGPMAEKLKLKKDQLIPFSVLNFRSEIGGEANRELERKITAAVEEQLAAQPGVVLLERRKLDALEFERICKWDRETAHFWTCGGLIDGSIAGGTETNRFKLTGIYNPPGGDAPRKVNISFGLDKLDAAAKACAEGLAQQYATFRKTDCWSPMAEGERFWEEAKSAYNAKLYAEAAAAIEVARILGYKNPEMARMRTDSYLQASFTAGNWNLSVDDIISNKVRVQMGQWEPEREEIFSKYMKERSVFLSRLSPDLALRAAEAFEEELNSNASSTDVTAMPGLMDFAELTTRMVVELNRDQRPVAFREVEEALCRKLTEINTRIATAIEHAAGKMETFCKSVNDAAWFARRSVDWYTTVARFVPAWAASNEDAFRFYRQLLRAYESPHLLCQSNSNVGIEYRFGAIYSSTRFPFYSETATKYPFFLDKLTGEVDQEAEKSWAEEFSKSKTDLATYAKLASAADEALNAMANPQAAGDAGSYQKASNDYHAFSRYLGQKNQKYLENAFVQSHDNIVEHNLFSVINGPPLLESGVTVEAELLWTPKLAEMHKTHLYNIFPNDPRSLKWPGREQTRVMDVRSIGGNRWFLLVSAPSRFEGKGLCLLWLVKLAPGGEETLIAMTPKPVAIQADPAQVWATDDRLVAATLGDELMVHDLATRETRFVKTHETCRWPVISGDWIYGCFNGDASGLLRVHKNTQVLEVLTSTRRKPALTPYDDQAPFSVGPGFDVEGKAVRYIGQWAHPDDGKVKRFRLLSVDHVSTRLSLWPSGDKSDCLPGGFNPDHVLLRKGPGLQNLITSFYGPAADPEGKPAATGPTHVNPGVWTRTYPLEINGHDNFTKSLDMAGCIPGESIRLVVDDHPDVKSPRYLLYRPPGGKNFTQINLLFPCSAPGDFNFAPPRRVAADEAFVYLFAGQGGAATSNDYADARVWRIPRSKMNEPALTPSETQEKFKAELMKILPARVIGMALPEGLAQLLAGDLIRDVKDARTTTNGNETIYHYRQDGLRLREIEGRIQMIECQAAGFMNGNSASRQTLPFGLHRDATLRDCRGRFGFPDYMFDHPESHSRNEGFQFGDLVFVVSYAKGVRDPYDGLKGINAIRMVSKPKMESEYTLLEQAQRFPPAKVLGMSFTNACKHLIEIGIVDADARPTVTQEGKTTHHLFAAHGVLLGEKDGTIRVLELRNDPASGEGLFAGAPPFELKWGGLRNYETELSRYSVESGSFGIAAQHFGARHELGPYQVYLFYKADRKPLRNNARGLVALRIERN